MLCGYVIWGLHYDQSSPIISFCFSFHFIDGWLSCYHGRTDVYFMLQYDLPSYMASKDHVKQKILEK